MDEQMQKTVHAVHSFGNTRLGRLGLRVYFHWTKRGGLLSLPPCRDIRITYMAEGRCCYGSLFLNASDIGVSGLTAHPRFVTVEDVSAYTIEISFELFYRLTGIPPLLCGSPSILDRSNPRYPDALHLFELPIPEWEGDICRRLDKMSGSLSEVFCRRLSRLILATDYIESHRIENFCTISDEIGISYRQLQRDFACCLGMTPIDYVRTLRFNDAVDCLKHMNTAEAALQSGYFDQAHMTKEFKRISGCTPGQIAQMDALMIPKAHEDPA